MLKSKEILDLIPARALLCGVYFPVAMWVFPGHFGLQIIITRMCVCASVCVPVGGTLPVKFP